MRNKLSFFVLVGALLIGILALWQGSSSGSRAYAADGHGGCVKECETCATSCEQALNAAKKSKISEPTAALEDCIQLCKTSRDFMSRGSAIHGKICGVCAEACKTCAEACDKQKDKVFKDCAVECRKCASSCEKMAS